MSKSPAPGRLDREGQVAVARFAHRWDKTACRVRARLGLEYADPEVWETLSHGWRKRWQMAAALAERPDLLLLDEPTNHVDEPTRGIFLAALSAFDGLGVLVSHDRGFLTALCSSTVLVRGGRVSSYPLPYAQAREQWRRQDATMAQERTAAVQRHRKAVRLLERQRRQAEAASKNISARRRMKSSRDADGRSVARKERAAKAAATHSRRASVLRDGAESAKGALAALEPAEKERGGRIVVASARPRSSTGRLLEWRCPERDVEIRLEADSRIHLTGVNGAGKSTILSALCAAAEDRKLACLHMPQEHSADEAGRLLRDLLDLPLEPRVRVLQIAARLGFEPDRLATVRRVSPGEARKLHLAWGLSHPHHLLLLDEPTNHLDVETIERIEEALRAYEGALVLVTHDAELAAATTTTQWEVISCCSSW